MHYERGRLTDWYQDGSAKGIREPYGSSASASSSDAAEPAVGAAVPDSAEGATFSSFFSAGGGVAGGVGGAACFLESNEPTWSCPLYFFSMLSLWYFQNCFEASLPATRVRTRETSACHARNQRVFHTFLATWMLILELGQVVDVLVNDDVEVGRLVM